MCQKLATTASHLGGDKMSSVESFRQQGVQALATGCSFRPDGVVARSI
jgi:hypothetical protein